MPGCYWKNGRDWYKLVDKHIIVFVEVCFSSADKCRISFRQEARDPTRTHSSAKQIYEFSVGGFIGYVQSWREIITVMDAIRLVTHQKMPQCSNATVAIAQTFILKIF